MPQKPYQPPGLGGIGPIPSGGLQQQGTPLGQWNQLTQQMAQQQAQSQTGVTGLMRGVAPEPPKEAPYSMKLCEQCERYDFAKDFRMCSKEYMAEGTKLLRPTTDPPVVLHSIVSVCWLCHQKAYLNPDESEGAYKTRMAMRKVK